MGAGAKKYHKCFSMLPSKGYFKSLDCPYLEIGFCDRPYCLFRHNPRYLQCSTLDSDINKKLLLFENSDKENILNEQQKTSIQYFYYKPTPISELNKLSVRNNSLADKTYVDQTLEEINFSGPLFKENTTEFDSKEETNTPENVTFNNVLSDDLKAKECEQAANDITVFSLMNESNCSESDENISKEDQSNCKESDHDNSYTQTVAAIKSHEKQKKEKWAKSKSSSLNKSSLKRKPKGKSNRPSNSISSKGNSSSHTGDSLTQRNKIITREEKNKNKKVKEVSNIGIIDETQKKYIKYEKKASKIKSCLKSKIYSNGEKEVLSGEYVVISSEDEYNSFSNKQTNKNLSCKTLKKDYSGKPYVDTASMVPYVDTKSSSSKSKNVNNKAVHSLVTSDSKRNFHLEGDHSTLDNRVERKQRARISMGTILREQKIRKGIVMMTPVRRLLTVASQRDREKAENITLKQNSTTVKIRSVPNVKLLLQEKEKLFKMLANKSACTEAK